MNCNYIYDILSGKDTNSLNKDISVTIKNKLLRFSGILFQVCIEGKVSQILNLVLRFISYFIEKN